MDVSFDDTILQATCRQTKLAQRKFGAPSAKKLSLRLSELFNAANVSELVAGRPHALLGERHGEFALDLYGGDRIAFRPTGQPPPCRKDGSIDWSLVTAVTIVFIGDYHE